MNQLNDEHYRAHCAQLASLERAYQDLSRKIEALRRWAKPADDYRLDGYYQALVQVRDIIDQPKPKWRQMVNKEAEKPLIGTPIGAVLYHLSHVANPNKYDAAFELADIIAVCEAQVGDGWQADPERVHPGFWGVAWLLVPLSHEPPDWAVVGNRAAAWLRSLKDEKPGTRTDAKYARYAYLAPKWAQDHVAWKTWKSRGWQPWACA